MLIGINLNPEEEEMHNNNDDPKEDGLSIEVDVETEPSLEDESEPVAPQCRLIWAGDHAEVLCESQEDVARARELLSTRPVKVKLKPGAGSVEDDHGDTDLSQ